MNKREFIQALIEAGVTQEDWHESIIDQLGMTYTAGYIDATMERMVGNYTDEAELRQELLRVAEHKIWDPNYE